MAEHQVGDTWWIARFPAPERAGHLMDWAEHLVEWTGSGGPPVHLLVAVNAHDTYTRGNRGLFAEQSDCGPISEWL